MSDPALALTRTLVARLRGAPAVTAHVPADRITSRWAAEAFPVIYVGEGQTVDAGEAVARNMFDVFADVHAFTRDDGFGSLLAIVAAIRAAVPGRVYAVDGCDLYDVHVQSSRTMSDPDEVSQHGVVTVAARARAVA